MNLVHVVHGVSLPLIPMSPTVGRKLNTVRAAKAFCESTLNGLHYVVQPWISGERRVIAVLDANLIVQDEAGAPAAAPLNRKSLENLPNKTVVDGVVHDGIFFVQDVLAIHGKAFINRSASERDAMAFQLNRLLNNPTFYQKPDADWVLCRTKNAPRFLGVVIKESSSRYCVSPSVGSRSLTWVARAW